MQNIIDNQINLWKKQAAELEAQLTGFDLSELKAHEKRVKEAFVNLSAENAAELKALLSSPLQTPSEMASELWNINLYIEKKWSPTKPEAAFIELDIGKMTVYAAR